MANDVWQNCKENRIEDWRWHFFHAFSPHFSLLLRIRWSKREQFSVALRLTSIFISFFPSHLHLKPYEKFHNGFLLYFLTMVRNLWKCSFPTRMAVANASPFQAGEQSHKPLYKMNLKYSHCKKSICRSVVYVMPKCLAGKQFTVENFSHQLLSKEQLDGIKTSGLW